MRDELLKYYNQELKFIKEAGAEFAQKHPGVASKLELDPNGSADPHVERMLQAFAFLAARIHLRIDDDFPELTEGLFDIVYPHYIRPVPSMGIVEFRVAPGQGKLLTGYPVARSAVLRSQPVDGVPCKFQTGWQTTIWPVRIAEAQWTTPQRLAPPLRASGTAAVCRLELSCDSDVEFGMIGLDSLRIYLNGGAGGGRLAHTLYELLVNNCRKIIVRDPDRPDQPDVELPKGSLQAVGFADSEALLPYPVRSFTGYRLLQEYFALPEKFLFLDLKALSSLAAAGFHSRAEILFLIDPFTLAERQAWLEQEVQAANFRLHCCPIINLFPHSAEPIHLDQTSHEYRVVPDTRRPNAMEIFEIDGVFSSNPRSQTVVQFHPAYSQRYGQDATAKATWKIARKSSGRKNDDGTDVWISVLDKTGESARSGIETLTVRCICTNRDLPARLPFGTGPNDFTIEEATLVQGIQVLRKPTPTVRPEHGKGQLWRLLSHFSLNYLSLVEEGKEAFQAILRLYNFSDSAFLEGQVRAIQKITSAPKFARVVSDHGVHFARGVGVELDLDEDQFEGGGAFLFASVLEQFLGQYVTLNGFSQLTVRTNRRKGVLKAWPPRAGNRILL